MIIDDLEAKAGVPIDADVEIEEITARDFHAIDPSVVHYQLERPGGSTIDVWGWQVGQYVIRKGVIGERMIADGRSLEFCVNRLPQEGDPPASMGLGVAGKGAEAMAWYVADMFSRYVTLERDEDFQAKVVAWSGYKHVAQQILRIGKGEEPEPYYPPRAQEDAA